MINKNLSIKLIACISLIVIFSNISVSLAEKNPTTSCKVMSQKSQNNSNINFEVTCYANYYKNNVKQNDEIWVLDIDVIFYLEKGGTDTRRCNGIASAAVDSGGKSFKCTVNAPNELYEVYNVKVSMASGVDPKNPKSGKKKMSINKKNQSNKQQTGYDENIECLKYEICHDQIDNDCDGRIDDVTSTYVYADTDSDGDTVRVDANFYPSCREHLSIVKTKFKDVPSKVPDCNEKDKESNSKADFQSKPLPNPSRENQQQDWDWNCNGQIERKDIDFADYDTQSCKLKKAGWANQSEPPNCGTESLWVVDVQRTQEGCSVIKDKKIVMCR